MDLLSLLASIMTLLIPAFIVYITRVGQFRAVKNEGKCFLVVLLICVIYGYKQAFKFSALLGSNYIFKPIITNLVIGIILGFASMYAAKLINEVAETKAQNDIKAQLATALEQNSWEFPYLEFYNLCKKNGVPQPDGSEFSNMKLQKAVQYILEKHDVPSEYQDKFLKNGAMYYMKAEAELEAEAKKEAMKKQKHDTTLVIYTPTDEEKQLLDGIHFLRKLHGLEKKRAMIKNKISALEQSRNRAYAKLNGESTPVSANLQKEKSWATWGGIADAIAGPAAGVMTALNIQQQNQKIREQNLAMLDAAAYLDGVRRKNAEETRNLIKSLSKDIQKLKDIVDKLSLKIVLSAPETKDIINCMALDNVKFNKTKSGILNVSANVKCVMQKEILPAANMVVDGTIHARVFLQDQFVEDIYFILPCDGISIEGKNVKIHSLCTTALPVKANYRLELGADSNLWVMEE